MVLKEKLDSGRFPICRGGPQRRFPRLVPSVDLGSSLEEVFKNRLAASQRGFMQRRMLETLIWICVMGQEHLDCFFLICRDRFEKRSPSGGILHIHIGSLFEEQFYERAVLCACGVGERRLTSIVLGIDFSTIVQQNGCDFRKPLPSSQVQWLGTEALRTPSCIWVKSSLEEQFCHGLMAIHDSYVKRGLIAWPANLRIGPVVEKYSTTASCPARAASSSGVVPPTTALIRSGLLRTIS